MSELKPRPLCPRQAGGQYKNDRRVLRAELHVERNLQFVFGSDAWFARRLDAELGQLHRSLAGVVAVLQSDLRGDWMGLPVQRQISAQRPLASAARFGTSGLE